MSKKNRKNKTKTLLLLFSLLLLIVLLGTCFIKALNNNSGDINLDPPTKEDRSRVDANKRRIVTEEQKNSQQNTINVRPVITYVDDKSDKYSVAGYVGGVFEDGGKCSFLFSNGSVEKIRYSTAISNVSYTTCPSIEIEKGELVPKGVWRIVLYYKTPTSSGNSEARTIEVQ